MKTAIVHDLLTVQGGAERVMREVDALYPATIHALLSDPGYVEKAFPGHDIVHSFIQKLPGAIKRYPYYMPLFPLAVESFDLHRYDLVISDSSIVAKGARTRAEQPHICYCHTPMRFAWEFYHFYMKEYFSGRPVRGAVARVILHFLRMWDIRSAKEPDLYIANSRHMAKRIAKLYGKKPEVIYPPVDTDYFRPGKVGACRGEYYVAAGRLVKHKAIDRIVEAFSRLPDRKLVVVGGGPELRAVKQKAGKNVEVIGPQSDETLREVLRGARAFLNAAVDDFGILPVEANACGIPVIAYGKGGVTESIVAGKTGLFYDNPTPQALKEAIVAFERTKDWDPSLIRRYALRFSATRFRDAFRRCVGQFCDFGKKGYVQEEKETSPRG
ncbi:MAG: glycosyltransferase [Simkaniaceae bacterium]|nr:glycosyltransferase [Simkaniaceae bacterium]